MAEVYAICFPNGKLYIGITTRAAVKRLRRHVQDARKGSACAVHNAIRKYGQENVRLAALARGVSWEEAKELEVSWIDRLRTMNRANGYNMTAGGDGLTDWIPSEATREKWRRNCRGPKSPEHRERIAEANRRPDKIQAVIAAVRGKSKSPEHCEKLAHQRGWKHSNESRCKMRLAWQRRRGNQE